MKKLRFQENSGLDNDWRNMLTIFEATLRMLHPVMPFITEELWQRLAENAKDKPASIALASFPQYDPAAVDSEAEREMQVLQDIVTSLRNLRADLKLDPKLQMDGTLYSTSIAAKVARSESLAIERMGNVKLDVREEAAPRGDAAIRSATEFDVRLEVPQAQLEERRKRMEKDLAQLDKNIANSERQLSDETFLSRAPEKVVDSIRAKLAEYKGQMEKLRADLG
jgi:valyl-tRNA synthetase